MAAITKAQAGDGPAADLLIDPDERRAGPRTRRRERWLPTLLAICAATALLGWWTRTAPPAPRHAPVQLVAPPAAGTAAAPIPGLPPDDGELLAPSAVQDTVRSVLGQSAVARLLLLDRLPQRVAATVDNLGREHAPVAMWPVVQPGGRFEVIPAEGGQVPSPENFARYEPVFTALLSVDPVSLVAAYRQLYPTLQQAWRELGMGAQPFHQRLVQVLDLMLATPEPSAPPIVQLTEVKGPVAPVRPWVRYEFTDPALEALPAGSKMLLRLPADQRQRVKERLAEIRALLVADAQQR